MLINPAAGTDTQKLSNRDIRLLTKKADLEKEDWDNLFEELEISAADQDIGRRKADTKDFKLQASTILRAWRKRKGKDATKNVIIDALRKCRLTEVIWKWWISWRQSCDLPLYAYPLEALLEEEVRGRRKRKRRERREKRKRKEKERRRRHERKERKGEERNREREREQERERDWYTQVGKRKTGRRERRDLLEEEVRGRRKRNRRERREKRKREEKERKWRAGDKRKKGRGEEQGKSKRTRKREALAHASGKTKSTEKREKRP